MTDIPTGTQVDHLSFGWNQRRPSPLSQVCLRRRGSNWRSQRGQEWSCFSSSRHRIFIPVLVFHFIFFDTWRRWSIRWSVFLPDKISLCSPPRLEWRYWSFLFLSCLCLWIKESCMNPKTTTTPFRWLRKIPRKTYTKVRQKRDTSDQWSSIMHILLLVRTKLMVSGVDCAFQRETTPGVSICLCH